MIKVVLQDTLDELNITIHKLSVEYKIRSSTLYSLINGNTSQIKFETIETILNAINEIAIENGINKTYTITDIIDYEYVKKEVGVASY